MAQNDIYIGREIGNYRIEREIASGSFGTVYLARHLHLKQRTVVIKILHALRLGSEQEKEQFLLEAQILETLKGLPNILPLLDVGIDGHVPYMIAEYAERGSLRTYMRQNGLPLSVQETLKIIEQVGHGLENAHNQGIVHRDLKPENILFNAKGEALLADFGLSTILSTTSVTYARVEGTPAYMAPEQFRGEVSKESDQYALACITYELLTGHKLFEAPSFVAMGFLHSTKAPTPPTQLNPQIPASVEHALLKALSKERTERYPSISAFVASLNTLDDSATLLLTQRSPTSPSTPPETSNPQILPPSSTLPGMPTRALYPPALDMTATSPMYNPTARGTYPPVPAYPAGPGPVWSPPPPSTPPAKRNNPAPLIILVIIMLLVLSGSGLAVFYYFSLSHPTGPSSPPSSFATITITPVSKTEQDTYMLMGINGSSNIANRQVGIRQLTSTKTTTQQVTLTHVHQDAVAANGNITFFNSSAQALTIVADAEGDTFQVGTVQIVTDKTVVVPAANNGVLGRATVSAHAVQTGTAGNIAAFAINQGCCNTSSLTAQNQAAFTGGTNAVDYNSLKQSDVDAVTSANQDPLTASARNDITGQKKTNEQFLHNITCNGPQTTSDVTPGAQVQVTTANVTVSVTCNAQVYDANAAQTIAHNSLSQKANTDPQLGPAPLLAGTITTQIQPQTQQDGSVIFSVTASGIWYYNWTETKNNQIQLNRQSLLNTIKDMSKTQAQNILNNNYPGISNATIDITNNGTTLPPNPTQIKLIINPVKGP